MSTTSTTLYRLPTCSARLGSVCSARRPPRRRSALTPPRFAPLNFTSRSLPDPKVSSIPLCSASPLLSRRTARLHCVLLGFTPLNFTSRSLPDPKVDSIPLCSASLRSTSHRALSPTRKSARSRSAQLHFTVSKSCSVSLCFAQLRLRRPEELLGFTSLHSALLRYLEELLGFTSLGSTSLSRRTAPFRSAQLHSVLLGSTFAVPKDRSASLCSAWSKRCPHLPLGRYDTALTLLSSAPPRLAQSSRPGGRFSFARFRFAGPGAARLRFAWFCVRSPLGEQSHEVGCNQFR